MGTGPRSDASEPVSQPAEGAPMSHQSSDGSDLTAEEEQRLSRLLAALPGLAMPGDVFARITAAITSQAATRAALLANDAEPTLPAVPLEKQISFQAESLPSAPDPEDRD